MPGIVFNDNHCIANHCLVNHCLKTEHVVVDAASPFNESSYPQSIYNRAVRHFNYLIDKFVFLNDIFRGSATLVTQ